MGSRIALDGMNSVPEAISPGHSRILNARILKPSMCASGDSSYRRAGIVGDCTGAYGVKMKLDEEWQALSGVDGRWREATCRALVARAVGSKV